MLQIVFCSVIYQNNGHNMTYRWVSCHQVYDVFIKTNFNISNKANTFWECIFTSQSHANQVTQTLLDESMSEWVNRFKPDKKNPPTRVGSSVLLLLILRLHLGSIARCFNVLSADSFLKVVICKMWLNSEYLSFVHNFLCRPPVQALPDVPTAGHP